MNYDPLLPFLCLNLIYGPVVLVHYTHRSKQTSWKLTWVGQDGVCLRQELITADSLVTFSAPEEGEKRGINNHYIFRANSTSRPEHKLPPRVLRQMLGPYERELTF